MALSLNNIYVFKFTAANGWQCKLKFIFENGTTLLNSPDTITLPQGLVIDVKTKSSYRDDLPIGLLESNVLEIELDYNTLDGDFVDLYGWFETKSRSGADVQTLSYTKNIFPAWSAQVQLANVVMFYTDMGNIAEEANWRRVFIGYQSEQQSVLRGDASSISPRTLTYIGIERLLDSIKPEDIDWEDDLLYECSSIYTESYKSNLGMPVFPRIKPYSYDVLYSDTGVDGDLPSRPIQVSHKWANNTSTDADKARRYYMNYDYFFAMLSTYYRTLYEAFVREDVVDFMFLDINLDDFWNCYAQSIDYTGTKGYALSGGLNNQLFMMVYTYSSAQKQQYGALYKSDGSITGAFDNYYEVLRNILENMPCKTYVDYGADTGDRPSLVAARVYDETTLGEIQFTKDNCATGISDYEITNETPKVGAVVVHTSGMNDTRIEKKGTYPNGDLEEYTLRYDWRLVDEPTFETEIYLHNVPISPSDIVVQTDRDTIAFGSHSRPNYNSIFYLQLFDGDGDNGYRMVRISDYIEIKLGAAKTLSPPATYDDVALPVSFKATYTTSAGTTQVVRTFALFEQALYRWYDWKYTHSSLSYMLTEAFKNLFMTKHNATTVLSDVKLDHLIPEYIGAIYGIDVIDFLPAKFGAQNNNIAKTAMLVNSEIGWVDGKTKSTYYHMETT